MRKLLLLTGDIAAGKSTFSARLAERYCVPALQKDSVKEVLADHIGFRDRAENARLSRTAVELMCHVFQQLAATGGSMILEANFHQEELQKLRILAGENGYDVLTLVLRRDADVLYQRYLHRAKYENRHPAHLTAAINTRDDFVRCAEFLRRESVDGYTIKVDASDFSYQTDAVLLQQIDRFMSQ